MDTALLVNRPATPSLLLESLLKLIHAVPSGEEIFIATYYLRNMRLCKSLVDARARGVRVKLLLSGNTYYKSGNVGAEKFLKDHGFDSSTLAFRHPENLLKRRMHLKMFLASKAGSQSHICLFGTYNPSGNDVVEQEVFEVIGDQDSGYNLLLRIYGNALLYRYVRQHLATLFGHPRRRCSSPPESFGNIDLQFLPSRHGNLLIDCLRRGLMPGNELKIRVAVSHISDARTLSLLRRLTATGSHIEVIGHDSERRFPQKTVNKLTDSGIGAFRFVHPDLLPMHCKFVLVEPLRRQQPRFRYAFLGSVNLTYKSFHINDELISRTSDDDVCDALDDLYTELRQASRPA